MADPITIHSIAFLGDDRVEITWLEPHRTNKFGVHLDTVQWAVAPVWDEYNQLIEAARELVDAILVFERNPPQRIPSPAADA